jgi:formylglycine-generating enzyme required for sulfatase activity
MERKVVPPFMSWPSAILVVFLGTLSSPLPAGAFEDVSSSVSSTGMGGSKAAWGDYNNDGRVDLFVGGRVLVNRGSVFTQGPTIGGEAIWGDYNNDGYLDLFRYDSRTLYYNDGGGLSDCDDDSDPFCQPLPAIPGFTPRGRNFGGYAEYTHDPTGMVFVLLPGGTLEMGSPAGEAFRDDDEGPQHTVTLDSFLIAKTEVTQAQYEAVMTGHATLSPTPNVGQPGDPTTGPNNPVGFVSMNDLEAPDNFLERTGLVLPTEAQWEYACRAGQPGPYSGTGNIDDMGWWRDNSSAMLQAVGQLQPNQFGLHDMHGNVWEPCRDEYGDYTLPVNPGDGLRQPSGSGDRVIRGGSYSGQPEDARSANRVIEPADASAASNGFRPVLPINGGIGSGGGDGGSGFHSVPLPPVPSTVTRGATWGDWNGDRYLDLYIGGYETWPTDYYPDCILTNRKDGTFSLTWTQTNDTAVTPGRPRPARGITTADFDEDGDLDIFVSNYRLEPNALWINNGSGIFTDEGSSPPGQVAGDPSGSYPYGHTIGSVFGDFDDDGHIDLFVGNFRHNWADGSQDPAGFYRNRGPAWDYGFLLVEELNGADWQESYASPTAGDIDNDGDLDLFFTTVYPGDTPRLYRNDGGFRFENRTAEWGLSGLGATYQAAFADYDDDGYLDLVTDGKLFRNSGGSNHYLKVHLHGTGKFDATVIGAQARIDLDGKTLTRQVEGAVGEGNQNDPRLHFGLGSHGGPVTVEIIWPDGAVANITTEVDRTLSVRPGEFRRGDSNDDGEVDLSDAVRILRVLFLGQGKLTCQDAADSNDDGAVDTSDAIRILTVLFLGQGVIPPPGTEACGIEATEDELVCETYEYCP